MMIVPVLLFAFVTLCALYIQADEHALLIRGGEMNAGVKKWWTIMRAGLLGGLALATWMIGIAPFFSALLLFIAAWCGFTFGFRRTLNRQMDWDRHYLGSTSVYDVTCIALAFFFQEWKWPTPASIRIAHQSAYKHSPEYRTTVHRAERIASGVELTICALCAWWAW